MIAPRRTDPRGLAVRMLQGLGQAILPALAVLYSTRDSPFGLGATLFLGVMLVGFSLLGAWLDWYRRIYHVTQREIRVESGIFSRSARSIPLERVQDVSLEEKLLARLFGLVEVSFETGAGAGEDIKLAYLSKKDGEALRELVRQAREEASTSETPRAAGESDEGARAQVLFAMTPGRLFRFGLFEFSLAAVAVLFGATQQFDFLLPFEIWDLESWERLLAAQGAVLSGYGPMAQALGAAIAVVMLVLLGFATGIVRTALRDWGFVLEKTERGFRRRRGLLNRSDVVMPVHRVQAVIIATGALRYRFGWHSLSFVSLAQDAGASHHVVAPFARMEEIEAIVRAARFEPPGDHLDWRHASRNYFIDRCALALGFSALLAATGLAMTIGGAGSAFGRWLLAAGLALGALAVPYNAMVWRFRRHAIDARQIYSVSGWLAPQMIIGQRPKFHAVSIVRGPLAQRRGYATLALGLAGGPFEIRGIAHSRAMQLRDALLESMVSTNLSPPATRAPSALPNAPGALRRRADDD